MLSAKERIDTALCETKIKSCESITYVSFERKTGRLRLTSLNSNNLKNGNVRFESLLNAEIMNNAEFKSITEIEPYLLLKILANGKRTFTGIEQGPGKYKNDMILLIDSSKIGEAQIWVNNEYRK